LNKVLLTLSDFLQYFKTHFFDKGGLMLRRGGIVFLSCMVVLFLIAPAFAQEVKDAAHLSMFNHYMYVALAGALGLGFAALGCGIGQGLAIQGTATGIARNPGAGGRLLTVMMIGLAMIESLTIYMLVVVLIILYANPFHVI